MRRFNLKDVLISHLKGGGAGGQNKNKRLTGVRIEHLPTGITAMATERRSQQMNIDAALERLERKLEKHFYKPAPRKKSVPSHQSKKIRRDEKKKLSQKKLLRSNKKLQWD